MKLNWNGCLPKQQALIITYLASPKSKWILCIWYKKYRHPWTLSKNLCTVNFWISPLTKHHKFSNRITLNFSSHNNRPIIKDVMLVITSLEICPSNAVFSAKYFVMRNVRLKFDKKLQVHSSNKFLLKFKIHHGYAKNVKHALYAQRRLVMIICFVVPAFLILTFNVAKLKDYSKMN